MKHQPIKAPHLDPDNPLYWQEQHSPTEPVEVKISNTRKKTVTRRRKQDSRLFEDLNSYQLQAMQDINAAYLFAVGEVGFKIMRYERHIRGTRPHFDRGPELRRHYLDWVDGGGFSLYPALAIIVQGRSILQTAAEFNKRRSWVRDNFEDSLRAYCKLRGWTGR